MDVQYFKNLENYIHPFNQIQSLFFKFCNNLILFVFTVFLELKIVIVNVSPSHSSLNCTISMINIYKTFYNQFFYFICNVFSPGLEWRIGNVSAMTARMN